MFVLGIGLELELGESLVLELAEEEDGVVLELFSAVLAVLLVSLGPS